MKSLTPCLFSLAILLCLWPAAVSAQRVFVRSGIYDFTDNAAREFYVVAPTFLAGYEAWHKPKMGLVVTSGLSFNAVRYNGRRHYLYMVPLLVTFTVKLMDPASRVIPVAGMGMGVMEKIDQNASFDQTYYSFAYGYHATGGLRFRMTGRLSLTFDLTYNLIMPPVQEEVNPSGVLITIGLGW